MNELRLFLPCAAGVEPYLVQEVARILSSAPPTFLKATHGGVQVHASWRQAMQLNLYSRLASRVLIELAEQSYRNEHDVYEAASGVAWEIWFSARQSFKIDITATRSPLKSIHFAALRVKDAICDRFRAKTGNRPDVDTKRPDVRVYTHLSADRVFLYVDTSGEPLFKRGWRQDKGDAPLKETLAAAMLAASGWWKFDVPMTQNSSELRPLYDPFCGSGTVLIEAAQIALNLPAGGQRQFGFERLLPYQEHVWVAIKNIALHAVYLPATDQNELKNQAFKLPIYGSDVAHRMIDFAQRNATAAGVAPFIELRGGDALQRKPPCAVPPQGALILTNPPYGERIEVTGVARRGRRERSARESAYTETGQSDFFLQLAAHWKTHFAGWQAHLLCPDMMLPSKMRLKESRRVPLWNGSIECRLFRFDLQGHKSSVAR